MRRGIDRDQGAGPRTRDAVGQMKTFPILCAAGVAVFSAACDRGGAPVAASISATTAPATRPVQPGDAVPDFPFVNQAGKSATFSTLQPRAVLITFIFTRCT